MEGGSAARVRQKPSPLSSLFDYLCERNAVRGNPVGGVKRPVSKQQRGKHACAGRRAGALAAGGPCPRFPKRRKGPRDSGHSPLSRHSTRRIVSPSASGSQTCKGVMHMRIHGKRDKVR
jgi:integrase/recombinase XerD